MFFKVFQVFAVDFFMLKTILVSYGARRAQGKRGGHRRREVDRVCLLKGTISIIEKRGDGVKKIERGREIGFQKKEEEEKSFPGAKRRKKEKAFSFFAPPSFFWDRKGGGIPRLLHS